MCMHVAITGASRTVGSVVVQGLRVEDAYGLACPARRRSGGPGGLRDGPDAPAGVAAGMREAASGGVPVVRSRTGLGALGDATHRGPEAVRRLP